MMKDQPDLHRFQHQAMATIFEIFVARQEFRYARQAAMAAFDELDRLEREISRYVAHSDVARVNLLSPGQTLRVGLDTFACLQQCRELFDETGGVFDVTIGQLLDAWRDAWREGREPTREELERLRRRTGMTLLQLDESQHSVTVVGGPVRLDLGGFGKGYALDQMVATLREWDIHDVLIHGGRSTALGIGAPPGEKGWPVDLRAPRSRQIVRRMKLRSAALSGSGLTQNPHIIDPRSGRPISGFRATWCLAKSAATADALSTAFMVLSGQQIDEVVANHRGMIAVVVDWKTDGGQERIRFFGDPAAGDSNGPRASDG